MTAFIVGTALALGALSFVLYPLFASAPLHPRKGVPVCPNCGPRPEKDALFCSSCGAALTR